MLFFHIILKNSITAPSSFVVTIKTHTIPNKKTTTQHSETKSQVMRIFRLNWFKGMYCQSGVKTVFIKMAINQMRINL